MERTHSMLPQGFKKLPQYGGLCQLFRCRVMEGKCRLCSLPSQPPPFVPTSIRASRDNMCTSSHALIIFSSFLPSLPPKEAVMAALGRKELLSPRPAVAVATRGPEGIRVKPQEEEAQASAPWQQACIAPNYLCTECLSPSPLPPSWNEVTHEDSQMNTGSWVCKAW